MLYLCKVEHLALNVAAYKITMRNSYGRIGKCSWALDTDGFVRNFCPYVAISIWGTYTASLIS